jgi:hypothetical protein
MSFKFDPSNMLNGLAEAGLKTKAAVGLYADTSSKKMENYAKTNYKWNDQTFKASRTLYGKWYWNGDKARIEIGHGVDYGIYLEFCHERRYAIIKPTLDKMSPQIIKGLGNILK